MVLEMKLQCPNCDHGTIRETHRRMHAIMMIVNSEEFLRRCAKEISVDEAKKILGEGKSELIEDFISKRGKAVLQRI